VSTARRSFTLESRSLSDEQAAETPSGDLERFSERHARAVFVLIALPPTA
jgi:hypothetical protein